MEKVRDMPRLKPDARFEDAPLLGLETYDPEAAIELIRSLREEGDVEEQRATFEFLKEALNAARPEGQKVFPEE